MEDVCAELDKTVLELMSTLQQLSQARKRYGEAVSEGYFNLAKARYSMPPQSVGSLQYDSEMTPLALVETSPDASSSYDDLPQKDQHLWFTVSRPHRASSTQIQTTEEIVVSEDTGQKLRRRRPASSPHGSHGDGGSTGETGSGVEKRPRATGDRGAKDPLRWFGILTPQSLHHAQQYFVQAVSHCAEIATLQGQVEMLRRKYHKLLAEKETLLKHHPPTAD